jgi:hypothetical protein
MPVSASWSTCAASAAEIASAGGVARSLEDDDDGFDHGEVALLELN